MGIFDKIFKDLASQPEQKKQDSPDGGLGDVFGSLAKMKPEEIKSATKEMVSIRRRIEASRAEEKTPLTATAEDEQEYKRIKIQNYLSGFKGTVQPGELLLVRMLDNSNLLVMRGGALRVVDSAMDTHVTQEAGAEVDIAKMDASVTITDKAPTITNCPNCGAPLSGSSCGYCGTKS